jgi:hypothetical protein
VPPLVNPPKVFDLDEPDMDVFGSIPEWIQKKIKGNLNFQGSVLQRNLGAAPAPAEAPAEPPVDPSDEEEEVNPY